MRLIDADELKEAIEDKIKTYNNENSIGKIAFEYCEMLIDNAPTVPLSDFKEGYKQAIIDGKTNFSRPKGEWKLDSVGVYCSECKLHPDYSSSFCPFCGADMRGEEE